MTAGVLWPQQGSGAVLRLVALPVPARWWEDAVSEQGHLQQQGRWGVHKPISHSFVSGESPSHALPLLQMPLTSK